MRRAAIKTILQVITLACSCTVVRLDGTRGPGELCRWSGVAGQISIFAPGTLLYQNCLLHPSVFLDGPEPGPHAEAEQEARGGPAEVGGVVDPRDRKAEEDVDAGPEEQLHEQ